MNSVENVGVVEGSLFFRIPAEQSKEMNTVSKNCVLWGESWVGSVQCNGMETNRHSPRREDKREPMHCEQVLNR